MSAGGLILAIECSNPSEALPGSVALGRRAGDAIEVVALRVLAPEGRHDDALMPAIDAMTRGAGAAARDIGAVCVSLGPGGYTAVRIGVTTAMMIGVANRARCIGAPTACVAAHEAFAHADDEAVVVTLAAKHGLVWSCVVRRGAPGVVERAGVRDAAALGELVRESGAGVCVGDRRLPEASREAARAAGARIEPIRLTARACLEASTHFEPVDPSRLAPIYAREPEAVRVWQINRARARDEAASRRREETGG